jgi:hypothetical protein
MIFPGFIIKASIGKNFFRRLRVSETNRFQRRQVE